MMTTNNFEIFASDIFNFLKTFNNNDESREIHEILSQDFTNLDYVLNRCPKIKEHVDYLVNSNLIDEIITQETFFNENYYEYLNNSVSNIPNNIRNIISFYERKKGDSYFKFKGLYDQLSKQKNSRSLEIKYNINQLFKEAYTSDTYRHRCSVCQAPIAKGTRDLDHFLNKKYFPVLCIRGDNLIPMCKICNTIYKKERIPDIPIVHPNKVEFPISNITFNLDKLNTLIINEEHLSAAYVNYIEFMNLKVRMKHEDIYKEIETIIHSISNRTKDKVKKNTSVIEIKDILKNEIETYLRINSDVDLEYKHIKFQTLENILNNEKLLYQIVIPIHFMINGRP